MFCNIKTNSANFQNYFLPEEIFYRIIRIILVTILMMITRIMLVTMMMMMAGPVAMCLQVFSVSPGVTLRLEATLISSRHRGLPFFGIGGCQ